jgi:hypothetical protein
MRNIRTAVMVAFLAALPIGLIAQTQSATSQEQLGAATVTASPVVMEPSTPVIASDSDNNREYANTVSDQDKREPQSEIDRLQQLQNDSGAN